MAEQNVLDGKVHNYEEGEGGFSFDSLIGFTIKNIRYYVIGASSCCFSHKLFFKITIFKQNSQKDIANTISDENERYTKT